MESAFRTNLGDACIKILAEDGIAKSTSLQALDVGHNHISDVGGIALAKSLRHNTSLLNLKLNENCISTKTTREFKLSLRTGNYRLQHLEVNGNHEQIRRKHRRQLHLLCRQNKQLENAIPYCIPCSTSSSEQQGPCEVRTLALMPKLIEVVNKKPELIYQLVRSRIDIFLTNQQKTEQRTPRRRNGNVDSDDRESGDNEEVGKKRRRPTSNRNVRRRRKQRRLRMERRQKRLLQQEEKEEAADR